MVWTWSCVGFRFILLFVSFFPQSFTDYYFDGHTSYECINDGLLNVCWNHVAHKTHWQQCIETLFLCSYSITHTQTHMSMSTTCMHAYVFAQLSMCFQQQIHVAHIARCLNRISLINKIVNYFLEWLQSLLVHFVLAWFSPLLLWLRLFHLFMHFFN